MRFSLNSRVFFILFYIAPEDPQVLLAAESRGPAHTFQERCPGVRALAPRLKGAQTGHLIDGNQLDGVKLARAR